MAHSKGFSLIETLVAVMIASVAVLALLEVVSNASRTSENILSRFESSLMMGLVAGVVTDDMHGQTMSAAEVLKTRYAIDHSAILESLDATAYEIHLLPKETIDPFMGMGTASNAGSIAVQKALLKSPHDSRTFFRITKGES
ncbi:MAG: type IV pilus modification PilV family protein [Sulfuricurvum sp.]